MNDLIEDLIKNLIQQSKYCAETYQVIKDLEEESNNRYLLFRIKSRTHNSNSCSGENSYTNSFIVYEIMLIEFYTKVPTPVRGLVRRNTTSSLLQRQRQQRRFLNRSTIFNI